MTDLLSLIWKRFEDAGLKDIAVESGILGEESICGILVWRKYNRAARLHKLFMRPIWEQTACDEFYTWMVDQYPTDLPKIRIVAIQLELHSNITRYQLNYFLCQESSVWIFHLFNMYLNFVKNKNVFLFFSIMWMKCIYVVYVVPGLIHASREVDWLLHLTMIRAMLSWTCPYGKPSYARYLSV